MNTHQLSFYPNSNALLHVERFKIICLLCHLGGMADLGLHPSSDPSELSLHNSGITRK